MVLILALFGVANSAAAAFEPSIRDISTHSTTSLSRSVDQSQVNVGETITVTVTFTNNEATAPLRGFYYAAHLPEELTVTPISVSIGGSPVLNFISESSAPGVVYANTRTKRWILETPVSFAQNNPINSGATVQLVYTIETSQAGTYNLAEFNWAGSFPDLTAKEAFGYSETADNIVVEFTEAETELQIDTPSCPNAVLNTAYDYTLQASGGVNPYAWTITSGSLHADLSLNPTSGQISGTPVASPGLYSFTVQCADADTPTSTVTKDLSILVLNDNEPPSFTSATLTTDPVYETSTLIVSCTGWSDTDGDPEDYHYQWLKNSTPIDGATSSTLTGADFDRGDSITCLATAWDGAVEGNSIETAAVVILNSAPSFTNPSISPNPAAKSNPPSIACSGWQDADGDPEGYIFDWYIRYAGEAVWVPLSGATSSTLSADDFNRGDAPRCLVTAWDGIENGNSLATVEFTAINSSPTFISATIAPHLPYEDSVLSVTCHGWFDADNDLMGYRYQWIKNGYETIPGTTSSTLTSDNFTAADSISCNVTAWDGFDEGENQQTSSVVILAGAEAVASARKYWILYLN